MVNFCITGIWYPIWLGISTWFEPTHSQFFILEKFSRQNGKDFFTNSSKVGLGSTYNKG